MRLKSFGLRSMLLVFLMSAVSVLYAQDISISGTVTNKVTNEPLIGVTLVVKGTTVGTATDFNGNYSLNVPQGSTLVVSYIGYLSQEVVATSPGVLNVLIEEKTQDLDEVVIIGYGQVKKDDATGSVTAISSDDFNSGAITSPQELLQGKTPGVQITSSGGAPGAGSTIRIRGGSSLNASNDPLIVIDGMPVASSPGMRNPLSTIHPSDIESFTVLKDASATAIYGSRASNGVIIITTKSGKSGSKIKFNYNGNVSVGYAANTVDVLSGNEYRDLINNKYGADSDQAALLGNANTDWQDEIFRSAVSTDHNISMTGSAKNLPYRASLGFSENQGILDGDKMERYTATIGLSPSFFDGHLKINANAKGVVMNNQFANTGAIGAAATFDPTQVVTSSDSIYDQFGGYFTWTGGDDARISIATDNPVAQLKMQDDQNRVLRSLGNFQADYKFHFLPELRANINLAYDITESTGGIETAKQAGWTHNTQNGNNVKGFESDYVNLARNQLLDFTLTYANEVGKHKFDLLGGYSWQNFWEEGWSNEVTFIDEEGADNHGQEYILLDKNNSFAQYASESQLVSFFGRANYNYDSKYLVTFTLRNDGSSRFSEDKRWGLFPSLALGWKIDQEAFLNNNDNISALKLRAGWGITGQQDIGNDYPYLPRYTYGDSRSEYQFGNDYYETIRPEGYDENIKWEETTTYNVGVDYGFWKDRVNGSLDYYYRETRDLLNFVPVPAGSNLTNQITTNVGNLKNQGIEFAINTRPVVTQDLFWEVGFNVTYNDNEITKLTANDDPDYTGVEVGGISGGTGNTVQRHIVGESAYSFYLFEQVYDENERPIEGLYVDRNNDGEITEEDKYYAGDPNANYMLGISTRLEYKNWDFAMSLRGNFDMMVYNNVASNSASYGITYISAGYLNNTTKDIYNTEFNEIQYYSDYYLENASFLRLDNLSLGYTFEDIHNDMNLKLSFTGQNLATWTKYSGLDPEISGGIDNNFYPRPTTFMFGVNLDF